MELVTPAIGLIFWQTVTFLVVLFLLSKFAWQPIMSALRERETTIESALQAAEQAKLEMQQLKASNESLLQQARLERDSILKDAQEAANNLVSEARNKAVTEANTVIANAKATILTEKQAALTELRNQVAALSIDIAEKVLKKELSTEMAQKELVAQYVKESSNLN
jgi:F-type H+-transporting ATPase subunit b